MYTCYDISMKEIIPIIYLSVEMKCSCRMLILLGMCLSLTQEKEEENSIESSNDAHEISIEIFSYDYYDEEEPNYYEDGDLMINTVSGDTEDYMLPLPIPVI